MLLSSSNRKYPPFPLFSYFSVVVCLRCLLHHILSLIVYTFRENREFVFISIVQFMMSAKKIRFGLQIVFVCLYITPSHYHHCADFITSLSSLCKLYLKTLNFTKCLSDIICRVCKTKHIISVTSYPLYNKWGCVFSIYPFPLWWLREYIYIYTLS